MPTNLRTPRVRTISLQPRPRSPYQFVAMMEAITPFDGVKWWEKDKDGNLINQIEIGNAIAKHEAFNIFPKSEGVLQFRTYVTMIPPTLGFAYIKDDDTLKVTPAGHHVSRSELLQTLFLRQLLKWQYPSCYHGGVGGKGPAHFPLRNEWNIHPFICSMAICREVEYLTKGEVAMFLLTMKKDNDIDKVVDEIKSLRNRLKNLNSRERGETIYKTHIEKLREAYQPEIDERRYKIRQRATNTSEDMLEVKRRNTLDYSDTTIRYFRFTGIFKHSDRIRRLVISPMNEWKVEMLLGEKSLLRINTEINNKERYYEWFGNSTLPLLPWETEKGLLEEITRNIEHSVSLISSLLKSKEEGAVI